MGVFPIQNIKYNRCLQMERSVHSFSLSHINVAEISLEQEPNMIENRKGVNFSGSMLICVKYLITSTLRVHKTNISSLFSVEAATEGGCKLLKSDLHEHLVHIHYCINDMFCDFL